MGSTMTPAIGDSLLEAKSKASSTLDKHFSSSAAFSL